MEDSLARLIVGDTRQAAESVELPQAIQDIRSSFPANSLVPMIRRKGDKPSERVRMRQVLKDLRAEGMTIGCPDHHEPTASLQVLASFQQSGYAWRLVVNTKHIDQDEAAQQLRILQEKMQEQALPMLAYLNQDRELALMLTECAEDNLAWKEAGLVLDNWDGMDIHTALEWAEVFSGDGYYASSWFDAGFDLETAKLWYANGEGFDWADEAKHWMKLEDQGMTAEIAIKLKNAYIECEQAILVRKLWP
jgi:hypothetical protein